MGDAFEHENINFVNLTYSTKPIENKFTTESKWYVLNCYFLVGEWGNGLNKE